MKRLRRIALGGLLLALAQAAPAMATSMLVQDISALTRSSDAVVHGKVKKVESRWTGDRRQIVTDVTIDVAEFIKGKGDKTLVIHQPGGEVGEIGQKVSGLASFAPGEEVVVFLEKHGAERYLVTGMAQGKFRVERSSDNKAAFAIPDSNSGDAQLIDSVTGEPTTSSSKPMELDSLRAKVKSASKAKSGSPKDQKTP
jgi:hypothetical protein